MSAMTLLGLALLFPAWTTAVVFRPALIRGAPTPVNLTCPLVSPVFSGSRDSIFLPQAMTLPATAVPVLPAAPFASGPRELDSGRLIERLSERVQAADLSKPAGQESLVSSLFGETLEDGEEIYPRIIRLEDLARQEAELSRRKIILAEAVRTVLPALAASVAAGDWNGPGTTLDKPCCGDAAPKLALLLRGRGHALNVVEAETHYYLMQVVGTGQLIVDPTIRQFFGGPRAPPDVPTVFVGTISELNELFSRRAGARTGRHGVQRIYFSSSRVRNGHPGLDKVTNLP